MGDHPHKPRIGFKDEVAQLKDRVAELEVEIDQLKLRITELENENFALKQESFLLKNPKAEPIPDSRDVWRAFDESL